MSRASVAIIVAHPDDETLWSGGTILLHPEWRCRIVALCRKSDPDRSPRFARAAIELDALGWEMADLDDGPEQHPLDPAVTASTIRSLLDSDSYERILTHSPRGEYTRHLRHEEVSLAVLELLARGELRTDELLLFAYDDASGARLPAAIPIAPVQVPLDDEIYARKRSLIMDVYGFSESSWEGRTTPRTEALWRFRSAQEAARYFR